MAISFETERQRINSPECYFNSISQELRPKRDKMAKFLEEFGAVPTVPEGGYFMVADFSNLSMSIYFHALRPKKLNQHVSNEILIY